MAGKGRLVVAPPLAGETVGNAMHGMRPADGRRIIAAPARNRLGLVVAAVNRLGAPAGNVEKDS